MPEQRSLQKKGHLTTTLSGGKEEIVRVPSGLTSQIIADSVLIFHQHFIELFPLYFVA